MSRLWPPLVLLAFVIYTWHTVAALECLGQEPVAAPNIEIRYLFSWRMLGGVERSDQSQQLRSYPPLVSAATSKSIFMSLDLPDDVRQEVSEKVSALSEQLESLNVVRDAARIENTVRECEDELRRLLKPDTVKRCENCYEMASFYNLGPREYLRRSQVDPVEIHEFADNLALSGDPIRRALHSMEDQAYTAILDEVSTQQLKDGLKPVTFVLAHGWRYPNVSVIAGSLDDFQNKPFERVELPIDTPIFRLGALGEPVPVSKKTRDPFAECLQFLAASGIVREPEFKRLAEIAAAEHLELHEKRSKEIHEVRAGAMPSGDKKQRLREIEEKYFQIFEDLAKGLFSVMDKKDVGLDQISRGACVLNVYGPRSVLLSGSAESCWGKRLSEQDYRRLAEASSTIRSTLVADAEKLQARVITDSLPRVGKSIRPAFNWIHGPFLDRMPPVELLAYWADRNSP